MADIRIVPALGAINVTGSADFRGDSASTVLYVSGSGNVGVGTSNPISKLHIAGAVKATATTGHVLGTSTDTGRALSILNSGLAHGESYSIALGYGNSNNNQAEITYYLAATGSASNRLGLGLYNSPDTLNITGNGRVGIGTTAPGAPLHIVAGGTSQIRLQHSAYNYWDITSAYNNTNADLYFIMNGSEKFRINANGNVGIGTTNPVTTLHVGGNAGSFNKTAALYIPNANALLGTLYVGHGGSANISTDATKNLNFQIDDTTRMTISGSNGFVGIGVTNPSHKLTVTGGNLAVESGNTYLASGYSVFFDYGQTNDFYVQKSSTTLKFGTSGTFHFAGGSVGIGTASPSGQFEAYSSVYQRLIVSYPSTYVTKLTIGGNAFIQQDAGNEVLTIEQGYGGGDIAFNAGGATQRMLIRDTGAIRLNNYGSGTFTGTAAKTLAVDSSGNVIEVNNASLDGTGTANRVAYWTDSDTLAADNDFFFDGTNVGIGTTAAGAKLTVAGNVRINGDIDYSAQVGITQPTSGTALNITNQSDADLTFYITPSAAATKYARIQPSVSSQALVLNSSNGGNVGIGTTAPAAKLSVVGTTNLGSQNSGFYVTDSVLHIAKSGVAQISFEDYVVTAAIAVSASSMNFGNQQSDATYRFKYSNTYNGNYATTGTTFVQFNPTTNYINSGNVGIGTTSPTRKLHILSGDDTRGIMVEQTLASSYAEVHFKANREYRIGTGGSTSAAEAANNWYVYDATAAVQRFVIDASGNVGIGSTSPGYKLDVVSSGNVVARFNGSAVAASSATEIDILGPQSNGDLNLGVGGSTFTDSTNNIQNKGFITAGSGLSGLNLRSDAGYVQITAGGVAASYEVARFTASGNVGIGLTNPNTKLHILGPSLTVSDENTYGLWVSETGDDTKALILGYDQGIDAGIITAVDKAVAWKNLILQPNAGVVGIGITNPSYALDVYNTGAGAARIRITGTSNYSLFQSDNSSGNFYLGIDNSAGNGFSQGAYSRVLYSSGAYPLVISTNSAERVRIASDGNVGISTTSPAYKLDVAGTGRFTGNLYLDSDNYSVGGLYFDRGSSDFSTYVRANGYPAGGYANSAGTKYWLEIGGKGGVHVVLNTDGGAGATENDYDHFTVWQGSNQGDRLFYVTNVGNVTAAGNLTVNGKITAREFHTTFVSASIIYQSGSTQFGNSSDDIHRFSGSIGLNGYDSNFPFFVSDPSTAGSRYNLANKGMGFNLADDYAQLQLYGGSGAYIDFANAAEDFDARIIYFSNDRLQLSYGTDLVLNGTGVGIGTSGPTAKLHVYDNSDVWHTRIGGASGELRIGGQHSSGAVMQAYTPAGSVRDLYIQRDGGNVGIGNTGPSGKLHVTSGGGDGSAILRITGTASDSFNWASSTMYANLTAGEVALHQIGKAESQYNAGHYGYRHVSDGSTSNMLTMGMFQADYLVNILATGNVGIGTSTPSNKLQVVGGVTATSFTGSLQGDITGTAASETLSTVTGRGASTSTETSINATLNAYRLILPQNTVGTTYAGVSTQPTYYIGQTNGDNDAWKIYGESGGGSNTGTLVLQSEDDYDGNESIVLRFKKTYSAYNTTDALVAKFDRVYTNVNLGVGTTAPGAKVHVVGGFVRAEGTETDQYFLEGIRTGSSTTLRIYDNSSNLYYDSHATMIFRANQNGGSGGYIGMFGGNVGIGVSPNSTLHVSGSNPRISIGKIEAGSNNSGVYDSDHIIVGVGGSISIGAERRGDYTLDATTATSTTFRSRVNIWSDNEDHVTFGGASTHIVTAWEDFKIWINNDSTDAGILHLYNKSGKTEFARLHGDGASWFNGGNVGIGVTNPNYKLHVNGNAYINETLFVNQTTTVEDSLIVYDNVGIGTTSPAFKLQVAGAIASRTLWEVTTSGMGASGTQARRYELARAYMDYNDWNSTGTIEVELRENYFSKGLLKKYVIYWGYNNSSGIQLVEMSGDGDNNFQVAIGSPVQQSGDNYYVPIYADWRYYTGGIATIRTNRTRTASAPGSIGTIYVDESPSPSNISDFNADSKVTIGYPSTNIILGPNANVGIGTTSPDAIFHVAKGVSSGVGGQIVIDNPASSAVGNTAEISFLTDAGASGAGTRNGRILAVNENAGNGAANMQFHTWDGAASDERMRIASGGNVGIGTTSPASLLDVAGTWKLGNVSGGSFKSYTYGTQLDVSGLTSGGWARAHKISTSDSTGHVFFGVLGDTTTLTRAYWTIGDPSSIDTTGYNSSNGIILLKNGSVGIGTTNPAYKLEVNGNIRANDGTVYYGFSGYSYISYSGTDGYYRANGVHYFEGTSGFKGAWNASGNIGIGTTSPAYKLHVRESGITAAAISTGWPSYTAESAAQSKVTGYFAAGGNGDVSTGGQGASSVIMLGEYYDARGVITMLGAGGASPSDQGTGYGKDLMVKAGNSDNGNGYVGGRLFLAGGSGYSGGAFGSNYGAVSLQPQGGSVGIGLTNPTHQLSVSRASEATAYQLNINNVGGISDGNYTGIRFSQDSTAATELGNIRLHYYSTGRTALSLGTRYATQAIFIDNTDDGKVGIGTTAPGAKLDVSGDIFLSETGRLQGRAYPYDTTVGSGADASTAIIEAGSTNGYRSRIALAGGNATDPNTIKMLTTSQERLRITSGGKVGIGTTNPGGLLGLGTQSTVQSTSGITLGVNDSSLEFVHATFSNGFGSKIYSADSGGGVTSLRIAGRGNSTSWSDLVTVLVTDNSTTRGNVGIATTSPGEKLDVVGNIALSGIFKGTSTGENKNFASYDWHWLGRRYANYVSDVRLKLYEYFYSTTAAVQEAFVNCYDMNSANYMGENIWGDVHSYHAIFTTHIYVKRQFSVSSVTLNGDDPYALWVDGAYVAGADGCCSGTTYSYTFTQGWHRLDLIYSEGGGGHFVQLGWNPKDYTDYIAAMTPFGPVNFFDTGDVTMRNNNVGIGTTNPSYKLHVVDGDNSIAYFGPNSTWSSYLAVGSGTSKVGSEVAQVISTDGNLHIDSANNSNAVYIQYYYAAGNTYINAAGGSVGVGTTAPSYKLDVTGTIRATGDVIAYSDRRVKENIVTLENSLDLVTKLRGVEYNKIGEEDKKIGVIAQEVLEVLPQVVQQDDQGNYSVAYGNMAGLFIEAIKQQQTRIETLEDRISILEELLRQKL